MVFSEVAHIKKLYLIKSYGLWTSEICQIFLEKEEKVQTVLRLRKIRDN